MAVAGECLLLRARMSAHNGRNGQCYETDAAATDSLEEDDLEETT